VPTPHGKCAALLFWITSWILWGPPWVQAAPLDFTRDIRPVLADACFPCHGFDASARKAGLRLDVRENALKPAKSGKPPVVPGSPEESELYQRLITHDADDRMPPANSHKAISPAQTELLRRWIAEGAEYREHWSFLPPRRPVPPRVRDSTWPRSDLDRLVLARLEQQGMKPSREADRTTLIRRVTLDLTGLPPSPADTEAFLNDPSPSAYDRLVDRLLASSRYGERMAQDWLDAARFADSNGYQVDRDREMWAWRDWVIDAFNRNLPFDQFTIEQFAGDLLPDPTLEQRIATGFHRNHMINEEGGIIPEEFLTEYCADRVETTATVWLGLTMNCARCHDHKYDPLTQRDYYGLFAFFHNVPENGVGDYGASIRRNTPPFLKLPAPDIEARLVSWNIELTAAQDSLKNLVAQAITNGAAHEARTQRVAHLKKQINDAELSIPVTLVMAELETPRPTHILLRGAYDKQGEAVTATTPSRLHSLSAGVPTNRLGLARWLVDPANPLTARVTVNRFWQSVFGIGLVRTSEDFGTQGEPPSHPELLDWLATEFVRTGWDVKRLMRLLVTSSTYRQDSRATPESRAVDPDNRLLGRGSRHRLSSETIRDQALWISGLLVDQPGGPSVKPYHPPDLYEQVVAGSSASTYVQDTGSSVYRRTLYTYWKRSVPNPAMLVFDSPFRETCTVRRARTSTPLQALNLMNDPTYVEASRWLAGRMMREGGDTVEARLRSGFRWVTSREPRPFELGVLVTGWARAERSFRTDPAAAAGLLSVGDSKADMSRDPSEFAAYTTSASTLLNLDEVITRE